MTNPTPPNSNSSGYNWGAPAQPNQPAQPAQPAQQPYAQQPYAPQQGAPTTQWAGPGQPMVKPRPSWSTWVYLGLTIVTFISSFLSAVTLKVTASTFFGDYEDELDVLGGILGMTSSAADEVGSVTGTINWWGSFGLRGTGLGSYAEGYREEILAEVGGGSIGLTLLLIFITLTVLGLLIAATIFAFRGSEKKAASFGLIAAGVQFIGLIGAVFTRSLMTAAAMGLASSPLGAGFWIWLILFLGGLGFGIFLLRRKPVAAPAPGQFYPGAPAPNPGFPQQPGQNPY